MYSKYEDNIIGDDKFFNTPEIDHLFDLITSEINSNRHITCVIGPPKSGKTTLLNKYASGLDQKSIHICASSSSEIKDILPNNISDYAYSLNNTNNTSNIKKIIIFVDNAHQLTNSDFLFLTDLCSHAKNKNTTIHYLLFGTGELVQQLSLPENRSTYNLMGKILQIPKLTKEQSMAYFYTLMDISGCSYNLILNPEALIAQSSGNIGILRTMIITVIYKSLGEQKATDCRLILEQSSISTPDTPSKSTHKNIFLILSMIIIAIVILQFIITR